MPITKSGDLIRSGDWIKIIHPSIKDGGDGETVYVRIQDVNVGANNNTNLVQHASFSDTLTLDIVNNFSQKRELNWHNCYSFGNGVESNRIGDTFNSMTITPGVKVSTVFEEYKEEHRKYGLIYSGLYNDNSGINNLNQFIQGEKITKDINPTYGSIQKLHVRDTDLVTLCEDKVLRIMANKDAVYNADGNLQLVATENVLGQTIPFVGEFGISKNPESFVSEAYRSYFTDKQRGAVMRLSKDGLTPISMHGMKDWFRDNLSTSRVNLLGEDNLSSKDNWDSHWSVRNVIVQNGVATIGYYNNDIEDSRYGMHPSLLKNDVLEVGKKYRLRFDVIDVSGLVHEVSGEHTNLFLYNTPEYYSIADSNTVGSHVTQEFTATSPNLHISQWQINSSSGAGNYTPPGGTLQTIQAYINSLRADPVANPSTHSIPWLYGGIVTITNLVLEEVKVEPKIVGGYDDRQDEYNLTIHSAIPKTVSFREDVTGWVSFKSFFPENGISCANDYYTMKNGKLYQHHIQGVNRNTFYGSYANSSLNVILNEQPGSVKSFHALDYEGSQSRVEGIKMVKVIGVNPVYNANGTEFYSTDIGKYFKFTEEEMLSIYPSWSNTGGNDPIEIKQYRNNILIFEGEIKVNGIWSHPNPHGRRGDGLNAGGDWEIGDIITTEIQEKTVDHFNSMPKDGWWVSGIETDKQKGNLPEFIEKEGKWFNYIKGVDSDIDETTNFGSFDIQGIGIVNSVDGNTITFANNINSSLQIGDTLYFERPSEVLGEDLLQGVTDFDWTLSGGSGTQWIISGGTFQAGQGTDWGYAKVDVPEIIEGNEYKLEYTITVAGTGQFILANHAVGGGNVHLEETLGTHSVRWIQGSSNLGKISLYNNSTFDGTVENISVKQVNTGEVLGFTRLEANNMQKAGVVTGLTNNAVTIDTTNSTPPSAGDYILFAKNQVVNTSSLLGYYADIKLENNSKRKVEIFSLGSEVTESSK